MASFKEEDLMPDASSADDNNKAVLAAKFIKGLAQLIGAGQAVAPFPGMGGGGESAAPDLPQAKPDDVPSGPALTDPAPNRQERAPGVFSAPTADTQPSPAPEPSAQHFGMYTPSREGSAVPVSDASRAASEASGNTPRTAVAPVDTYTPPPTKNYMDQFKSKLSLADAFKLAAIPLGTTLLGGVMSGNRGALAGAAEGFKAIEDKGGKPGDVNKNRFEPIKTINPKTGLAEYAFFDRQRGITVDGSGLQIYDSKIWEADPGAKVPTEGSKPVEADTGPASTRSSAPADDGSAFNYDKSGNKGAAPGQPSKAPAGPGAKAAGQSLVPDNADEQLSNTYAVLRWQAQAAKNDAHADATDARRPGESINDMNARKKRGADAEKAADSHLNQMQRDEIAEHNKLLGEDRHVKNEADLKKLQGDITLNNEKKIADYREGLKTKRQEYTAEDGNVKEGRVGEDGKVDKQPDDPIKRFKPANNTGTQQNKAYADLLDKNNNIRRGTAAGKANMNLLSASNARDIVNMYPDLNKMPIDQVNSLRTEIANIASGGVAGEHAIQNQSTDTFESNWSKFVSKFGSPTGAQLGDFLKNNVKYLDAITKTSQDFVNQYRLDNYTGHKRQISKDEDDEFRSMHPDVFSGKSPQGAAPKGAPAKQKYDRPAAGQTLMRSPTGGVYPVPNEKVKGAQNDAKWVPLGPDEVK